MKKNPLPKNTIFLKTINIKKFFLNLLFASTVQPCDVVASEKKLREFVAKENIGGNYNNEKEIIGFKTQEDVYKIIRAMQKSCKIRSADKMLSS